MPLQRLEGPSLGNVTATPTATASVNATSFSVGANVSLNTTAIFIGNSTVNTVITSSSIVGIVSSPTGFATTLVAGETLAARDAVYVEPALTGGTAGRVYKMDADVLVKSTQAFFAGFALASASAAGNVTVQQSGVVSGLTGLTTGAVYYASGTAGAITATKPLHPVPIGIAISATQLLINTGIKRETEQSENVGAIYGYTLGGYSGGASGYIVATSDRITFSTSVTAASAVSNLSAARYSQCGVSDGSVYGYSVGGHDGARVATSDRITFSTSVTAASTVSNLSQARNYLAGLSDGAVYGYAMGGGTSGAAVATSDRITFSTSVTAASTVSNLSTARDLGPAGVSDGSVYGYAMGGGIDPSPVYATSDRITFSTSVTAASTVSNLSQARGQPAGVSDGSVYGYAMGGFTGSWVRVATTDRITFSTSVTAASTVSNLSQARMGTTGVSDGSVYGYAMGGDTASNIVATTDRITFSTSVTAASTVSNLSTVRGYTAGVSDGAV